jgi:archaellum component FlaC
MARADKTGWQLIGEREARSPVQVRGDNEVDHGRVVGRLQMELERLEKDMGGTRDALQGERASREELETKITRLLGDLEEARRESAALSARLSETDRAIADSERRARESLEAQEMLLKARRREADAAYVCGIAAEVFNRSPQLAEIAEESAQRGAPTVRLGVDGIALPRVVRIIFAWDGASRSFRITCDLVARIFDVADASFGSGMGPSVPAFEPNARFEDGRVVVGAR